MVNNCQYEGEDGGHSFSKGQFQIQTVSPPDKHLLLKSISTRPDVGLITSRLPSSPPSYLVATTNFAGIVQFTTIGNLLLLPILHLI